MNALDFADALRRHKLSREQPRPRRPQQPKPTPAGTGRPRRQSPYWTETELRTLHTRHAQRETIIDLAGGNEAIRVSLCREFKRRGWTIYRWRTR